MRLLRRPDIQSARISTMPMLMDAYAVVAVQSGCSSTLALLASLVIRLFSMLVCLWCQRPQGAMRQLMFLGDFLGWGGLIKFIRTSTHTSCYATGRFLGLPHTPNQLHIHTTHTKTADKTCPNSRSTVLVCCCGAKPSQARFSTNLANFVLELKKQGETFARRSGHTN